MAERAFLGGLLLLAIGYTIIAFTTIRAPIQYDPLGPESWPRILGSLALVALAIRLVRPSGVKPELVRATGVRILVTIALLFGYAALFEPLGFVLATLGFCTGLGLLLGATLQQGLMFGAATGLIGYFGATDLLDLNLPAGLLAFLD